MDARSIDDYLDELSDDDAAMIPRVASAKDLAQCRKDLLELALEPLPLGYVDFLKKCNGFAWNGIEFYSTDQVYDPESDYTLLDIVSTNDDFSDNYEMDDRVLLGRADDDYYTYNIETKKYEILEYTSTDLMEEFDSFEELFHDVVGTRLGSVRALQEEIRQEKEKTNKIKSD